MWNDANDWSKGHYQLEYCAWIKNTNAEAVLRQAPTFTVGTQYSKAIVYVDGVATVARVAKDGTFTTNIGCGEGVFIIPIA